MDIIVVGILIYVIPIIIAVYFSVKNSRTRNKFKKSIETFNFEIPVKFEYYKKYYKGRTKPVTFYNKFNISFEGGSMTIRHDRKSSGLRGIYWDIDCELKLDLPDFTMEKSTNISHILFTSDLLPQELSNVNIEAENLTQASMWFNVSPFIKFISYCLPFKSKQSYISSKGKTVRIKVFVNNNNQELIGMIKMIISFYTSITEILEDDSKRKRIRITKTSMNFHCQHCGAEIKYSEDTCKFCGNNVSKCIICYQRINKNSGVLNCCGSYVHNTHLENLKNNCPYCKQSSYQIIELVTQI